MERMMPKAITVSQLNRYVKSILSEDDALQNILVMGEISNFTDHYRSGHLYFSLKDSGGTVKAVMFASAASRLRFKPQDGMQVIVRGRISLYEQTGQYQLYAEEMMPDGLGALNLAFEQLKEKLEKEGLFENKRPLPKYPKRIGVITSPTGAAVRDIMQILNRRWPLCEVKLFPVQVQGENAASEISRAVYAMNKEKAADVLIVGRGGGSIEDLWAFNEEIVARAVAGSEIPVISAVGHETDFTICDFAADLRAPTPSAAAELAVPSMQDELYRIAALKQRLIGAQSKNIALMREKLDYLSSRPVLKKPEEIFEIKRLMLDNLDNRLMSSLSSLCGTEKSRLSHLAGKLDGLSPLKTLSRGYLIAEKNGSTVLSVKEVSKGDELELMFCDGIAGCVVSYIKEGEKQNG